jgi:hypothetical protein
VPRSCRGVVGGTVGQTPRSRLIRRHSSPQQQLVSGPDRSLACSCGQRARRKTRPVACRHRSRRSLGAATSGRLPGTRPRHGSSSAGFLLAAAHSKDRYCKTYGSNVPTPPPGSGSPHHSHRPLRRLRDAAGSLTSPMMPSTPGRAMAGPVMQFARAGFPGPCDHSSQPRHSPPPVADDVLRRSDPTDHSVTRTYEPDVSIRTSRDVVRRFNAG